MTQPYKVAVYTLTRDRIKYTQRCFYQLKNCGVKFDHIVLDNGSMDRTHQWLLTNYEPKKLILEIENTGLWHAIQRIIDETEQFKDYDYVIKIDNDMEFPQDSWLKKLIEVYQTHDYDVLSPFVEGVCDGAGGIPRDYIKDGIGRVNHVGGACLLTQPKFYDEKLPNGYMATGWDFWFCQGLKCGIVEDIHVKHDSKTMEAECIDYHKRQVEEQKVKYDYDNSLKRKIIETYDKQTNRN